MSGLSAFRPRNASTAARAWAAFAAWWAPYSGRKTSSIGPSAPLIRITWPPTASCRLITPKSIPSRCGKAPTSAQRCSSTCAASEL